jgi:hypothetical protein
VATPRLLDASSAQPPHRPDPAVAVLSVLGTIVVVGLFVAGVLAVYTYSTPDAEGPVVEATAAVFGVALLYALTVATLRHIRSSARA